MQRRRHGIVKTVIGIYPVPIVRRGGIVEEQSGQGRVVNETVRNVSRAENLCQPLPELNSIVFDVLMYSLSSISQIRPPFPRLT